MTRKEAVLSQPNKNLIRNSGFTIIEVMIVVAVAGLIIFIVLIAVPALKRSQRNTARKEDAALIFTAVNTYLTDHPELTLEAGPDQLLHKTGEMLSDKGATGKLSFYDNTCDLDEGVEIDDSPLNTPDNTSTSCVNTIYGDADDAPGLYIFREVNAGFASFNGPYHYSGTAFTPDTIHIMIGAVCDTHKPAGDPRPVGTNYNYFIEKDDPSKIAIGYAVESGASEPRAYCFQL